jgi:hypothetical protein
MIEDTAIRNLSRRTLFSVAKPKRLGVLGEHAEACETVFNLDREDLRRERYDASWNTRAHVKSVLNECLGDRVEDERLLKLLQNCGSRVSPLAVTSRQASRDSGAAVQKLFDVLLPLSE